MLYLEKKEELKKGTIISKNKLEKLKKMEMKRI